MVVKIANILSLDVNGGFEIDAIVPKKQPDAPEGDIDELEHVLADLNDEIGHDKVYADLVKRQISLIRGYNPKK